MSWKTTEKNMKPQNTQKFYMIYILPYVPWLNIRM